MSVDLAELRRAIDEAGLGNRVVLALEAFDPAVELDDRAARVATERWIAALGYRASSPESWRSITLAHAEDLLHSVLAYELAYDERVLDDARARELARKFLDRFSPPCVAFTNAELVVEQLPRAPIRSPHFVPHDWDCVETQQPYLRPAGYVHAVAGATFETGVVVVSPRWIGILWVTDED
jgi:hypothetical protein